jgi:hypothetical protein
MIAAATRVCRTRQIGGGAAGQRTGGRHDFGGLIGSTVRAYQEVIAGYYKNFSGLPASAAPDFIKGHFPLSFPQQLIQSTEKRGRRLPYQVSPMAS